MLTSVGRYQIVEELGRGAMGTVYKAYDPAINRPVAIKAIRFDAFVDPNEQQRVRDRIRQEARAAGVLSHPHIVTVFDVCEEDNNSFIITEFIGGPSLERLLRESRVPSPQQLLAALEQVAEALDYAHRKGVLHRDIKPGNLILTDEAEPSNIKVADFGVAKYISQDATHSGTMMGTPAYMSPEQIQGFPTDGRADEFSLAVVVYELLTGERPFAGEGLAALFYQVCKAAPAPPSEIRAGIPASVDFVLTRALSKDPTGRYATCSDFTVALREAYGSRNGQARVAAEVAAAGAGGVKAGKVAEPGRQVARPAEPIQAAAPVSVPVENGQSYLPRRRERPSRPLVPIWLLWIGGAIVLAVLLILLYFRLPRKQTAEESTSIARQPAASPATSPSVPVQPPTARASAPPQPQTQASPNVGSAPETNAGETTSSPRPPMNAAAQTEFVTQPAGARVAIDSGHERGCVAPCLLQLPSGRHTLVASLEGYRDERRIFTTPLDTHVNITLSRQEGVLVVGSDPPGSTVLIDGKEIGKTPLTLHLSVGMHQLVLVNGASRREDTVEVRSDSFESRSVHW